MRQDMSGWRYICIGASVLNFYPINYYKYFIAKAYKVYKRRLYN